MNCEFSECVLWRERLIYAFLSVHRGRLTGLYALELKNIACVKPSFSKDGEKLRKFLQFDTGVIVLYGFETEKLLIYLLSVVARPITYKTALLLPIPMLVLLHCASVARQI